MNQVAAPQLNRRQRAKAATRVKVIAAARSLFVAKGYADASIRDIAREAGMSTGAIFANFENKADLWRAVKGSEPPVETSVTRAAPAMLTALKTVQQFIDNGIELGFIRMPADPLDPAHLTPALVHDAIAKAEGRA